MTYVVMNMWAQCSMTVLLCDKHFQKQGVDAYDVCMYAYVCMYVCMYVYYLGMNVRLKNWHICVYSYTYIYICIYSMCV